MWECKWMHGILCTHIQTFKTLVYCSKELYNGMMFVYWFQKVFEVEFTFEWFVWEGIQETEWQNETACVYIERV